jgi:hypothetical protein
MHLGASDVEAVSCSVRPHETARRPGSGDGRHRDGPSNIVFDTTSKFDCVTIMGRDQLVVDTETYEIADRVSTPRYPFFSDVMYDSGN